ncbi:hypothetical protein HDV05_001171 [Chytridiales sp. JEL 0842]|nr:hypothetical protein HDV05_001171 [Chytridiales sp. JEL 0842]
MDSVKGLEAVLKEGIQMFKKNPDVDAIDVAQRIISILEDDPTYDAGTGSMLTTEGEVETDALIATDDLKLGSVACLKRCKNPINVARLLRDKGGPGCIMLSGSGAEKFAREHGVPEVSQESLLVGRELENLKLIKEGRGDHLHGKGSFATLLDEHERKKFPEVPSDTVGCIVKDNKGVVCVALSTGGTPFKRPGRIGDTPLWGSGGYAFKGMAAGSTGFGEDLMRVVMAKSTVDRMRRDMASLTPMQAAAEQVEELKELCQGLGGVIVLGPDGSPGVAFNTSRMAFGWVQTRADGTPGEIVVGVEPGDLMKAKTKMLSH